MGAPRKAPLHPAAGALVRHRPAKGRGGPQRPPHLPPLADPGRQPKMAFFWDDPWARGPLREAMADALVSAQAG
jgi:hypothetical protein